MSKSQTQEQSLYFKAPNTAAECSTPRSAALRQRRFDGYYLDLKPTPAHEALAEAVTATFLAAEADDPAMARALAMRTLIEGCEINTAVDNAFLGGDDPFFFNLMLRALNKDRYSRERAGLHDPDQAELQRARAFLAPCFEGHITPGIEQIIGQGLCGLRFRIESFSEAAKASTPENAELQKFYRAALQSVDNIAAYAKKCAQAARDEAAKIGDTDPALRDELLEAARIQERVPENPAETFREALQSYWTCYITVTTEMGGCTPGGGIGLGRPDRYLYPYLRADLEAGRITRAQALELMEMWLLNFRHVDYYTPHAPFTPGSQCSIGGITPEGLQAANELTELIMEASLRIQMPAPYISVRLNKKAPERFWQASARYIANGLGFSVVNDEVLIPAFLKHGRSLADARDYICSCCYENTIPGREAFHPNCAYINLPLILEMTLFGGKTLGGRSAGLAAPADFNDFEAFRKAFAAEMHHVITRTIDYVNRADRLHTAYRRYPMMSLFIDDCLQKGKDVCAGGARYNMSGMIVAGLPNIVNSLYAVNKAVFTDKICTMDELRTALKQNFAGSESLRAQLRRYAQWGNGIEEVDENAAWVTQTLYGITKGAKNARGGRWQLALYSFVANHDLGMALGATPDGRGAGESITRNNNPTWGTDRNGPTAVLRSLSAIDLTSFPNGESLDMRFDPSFTHTEEGLDKFAAFLKGFTDSGVMQMQLSMVDTATLVDAKAHPEKYPDLMVKVAGYSARFVDLSTSEKNELIGRSAQWEGVKV